MFLFVRPVSQDVAFMTWFHNGRLSRKSDASYRDLVRPPLYYASIGHASYERISKEHI